MSDTPVRSRTLVVLDAEHFAERRVGLRFVQQLGRATLLLAFRSGLRLDLDLAAPLRSLLLPIPAGMHNPAEYLAQAVLFEARRGYRRILVIAPTHPALLAAVQFLRQQGLRADLVSQPDAALTQAEAPAPAGNGSPLPGTSPRIRIDPRTGKRRRRRRVKLPTTRDNMVLVMRALLKNFRIGEVYSKTQISPIIHKETQRNVKDLFPYKNLTGLYRYLLANDLIEEVDAKTFRVISTDWTMPPEPVA